MPHIKHIEILTEEPSAEAALKNIIPKIIGNNASFKIITHQGKSDLLAKLPLKLKTYKAILKPGHRVVVLVDKDKEDCILLKQKIEKIAQSAGLKTKTTSGKNFQMISRIAIEELEAWFIGDENAIRQSYVKVPAFAKKYRTPDNISNTWEALELLLTKSGYKKIGGKIEVARKISANMNPDINKSTSFQVFRKGILACL
jgi:hypothetical protein